MLSRPQTICNFSVAKSVLWTGLKGTKYNKFQNQTFFIKDKINRHITK